MPDRAELVAQSILDQAGTPAKGSLELMVTALRQIGGNPDLHQRLALEVIAAGGLATPGSFEKILGQLRARYPAADDVDAFVVRVKRRVSLKTGKVVPHAR